MNKILSVFFTTLILVVFQVPMSKSVQASETSEILGGYWTIESTDEVARVSWEIPVSVKSVTVYQDGKEIAVGDESSSIENIPVQPNSELDFNMVVRLPLTPEQALELSAEKQLTSSQVNSNFEQVVGSGMSLSVPSEGSSADTMAFAATGLPDSTLVRYTTFIPNFSVEAPFLACTPADDRSYRFLGDNRGANPTATSFRTRFDVRVNWTLDTKTITKSVGQTKRQVYISSSQSWVPSEYATASTASMIYTSLSPQSGGYAKFNMRQDVLNPLCNDFYTNGIYFDFDVSLFQSGSFSFGGTALLAPDHELYIKDSDSTSWTTVFNRPTKTMNCLADGLYHLLGCTLSKTYLGAR
jgi:hypothetical protein